MLPEDISTLVSEGTVMVCFMVAWCRKWTTHTEDKTQIKNEKFGKAETWM